VTRRAHCAAPLVTISCILVSSAGKHPSAGLADRRLRRHPGSLSGRLPQARGHL